MTLILMITMVAFVGCGPDSGKTDTPDEPETPAGDVTDDAATDDTAATDDDGLDNLDAEFSEFEVQGGSSASARRDGGAQ
jgi:hypothetical protein